MCCVYRMRWSSRSAVCCAVSAVFPVIAVCCAVLLSLLSAELSLLSVVLSLLSAVLSAVLSLLVTKCTVIAPCKTQCRS